MFLSDSLTWALYSYDTSGIKVFCNEENREAAMIFFKSSFEENWKEALKKAEEIYGDIEEDCEFVPVFVYGCDEGFFISIECLEIRYCGGDFYDFDLGSDALQGALKAMTDTYPSIEYEGCMECCLSDRRAGEACHWDISTRDVEIYDFLGKVLAEALENDLEEKLMEELSCNEDFEETINALIAYSEYLGDETEPLIKKVLELAEEYDCEEYTELVRKTKEFFGEEDSEDIEDGEEN